MDWGNFIKTVIALVGSFGALAWFGRPVVLKFLDAAFEAHKRRIDQENAIAVERLRAELQGAAGLAQARYSALVERQATAVADLYANLVDAEAAIKRLTAVSELLAADPAEDLRLAAEACIATFADFLARNRILLSRETCEGMDEILKQMRVHAAEVRLLHLAPVGDSNCEEYFQKMSDFQTDTAITDARKKLEDEFRKLLGVSRSGRSTAVEASPSPVPFPHRELRR